MPRMSLRKSALRTPALLAACRANAQHSTGPRTPEGKARGCLNALRHGRRAGVLARLLPRGLSYQDRMLYNWILRALNNGLEPQTVRQEAKVRRAAIEIWCAMRAGLKSGNNDQSGNVTENRPLRSDTKPRIWFRLQSVRG